MKKNNLTLVEFISRLHNQGIKVSANGNKLLCHGPQGTLTPILRQEIAERKAEILRFLQQIDHVSNSTFTAIKSISRDKNLPLSFSQERLWFINQLEDSNAPYIENFALRITGNLNVLVLERAFSEILRRHEVLRTSFSTVNGKPIQIIDPDATLDIKTVDLQRLEKIKRETFLQQQLQQEATGSFHLEIAPLIRCNLWQLETREYLLLLTMHHIISDSWSMGIFIQELSNLYQAFITGKPSPLPELPIQYADFVVWQRQWLRGEILKTQLNYWKTQLAGAPYLLRLPTDRPRPKVQTYRGATQSFTLNTDLTQKLQTLSRNLGTTLFMTLHAAFTTLLYRYSGQSDILIGSPIANRNHSEIESLIGFFVNTLVLRTRFEENPSFEDLLTQVKETTLKAYEHQDVPFEQVVEALQPQRSLSYSPLFQVMFVLQNAPMSELELSGCNWCELEREGTVAKFDLKLSMSETSRGLVGSWEYNTDLFDSSTIERMAGHFQNLLSAIVENPQLSVAELSLLSEAERYQLLVEWNDTETEYPSNKCIHQLFEKQVEQTPDAVAVVFENQQLTYKQLNQRANQLAHYLQSLGVRLESLVGICMERSVEMIVGLLGILKVGSAYVPFDPSYPAERLSYMLEDSGVEVLLTQKSLLKSLPRNQKQTVCLDRDRRTIEQQSQENLEVGVDSENLAYVIYTSGSTGKPKGVMVSHKPVVNLIDWVNKTFDVGSKDRILFITSLSFDLSVYDIFGLLAAGGSIHIASELKRREPGKLLELLFRNQITFWESAPGPFEQLVPLIKLQNSICPNLRILFLSGDWISLELPNIIKNFFPNAQLVGLGGATEATVWSNYYMVKEVSPEWVSIPYGKPIQNVQYYILNRNFNPCPIGVSGELYIGGKCLASGYLNNPEKNLSNFIPNPFKDSQLKVKSPKLYKTGDLARYSSDGNIEFLGRIDNQVKVRGFRIELGEIEAVLNSYPQIQQALVIATEELLGNKRLVAYVVTNESLSIYQLRKLLKQKLPEYMIPSSFVTLDTFPLTPNGKIDRKALPTPNGEITQEQEYVAPRTPREKIIAKIFANVLGIKRVGIHDNFFELGGHSLQAAALVFKLSIEMKLEVSLKLLFSHPTVIELAEVLNQLPSKTLSFNQEESPVKEKAMIASPKSTKDYQTFCKLEQQSLLSLFAVGKIAPVDSAALGYFPLTILKETSLTRNEILQSYLENLPIWYSVVDTQWGRIAILILPIFEDQLYSDSQKLVRLVVEALEMARHLGAKTVSLTGLIPSATDYGRAIVKAIDKTNNLPKITTGHATTCSTVVLTIKKIVQISNRSMEREQVAFIGLGSIGLNSLRLMLKCLPHPSSIILCDVYSKLESIQNIQHEIINDLGFQGSIQIATSSSSSELPLEVYNASLIIGATNVSDILDIQQVKPNTLIVDDSGPHCFSLEQAIKRFEERKDILFTEGGSLQAPTPMKTVKYLPEPIANKLDETSWNWPSNPRNIMGCVLSSLLSSCFDHFEPTIGSLNIESCVQHYRGLEKLDFQASDLHCEHYSLPINSP